MSPLNRRTFLAWTGAATLAAWAAPSLPAALAATPAGSPPPLDSLTSAWLPAREVLHFPAVSNFWGRGRADNVLAIRNFTLAPYLDGGRSVTPAC